MLNGELLLALAFGYLFGSVPYALVIGKVFYHTDIRTQGSGNLGGTNAGRVLGKAAGISVSVLDVLKAAIVVVIVYQFRPEYAALAGVFATLGHCYPLFAQFKGGKAVSTAYGYLLGVSIVVVGKPLELFVIPALLFFTFLKLTKWVSFSSMLSISITVILSFFIQNDPLISFYLFLIDILLIWRHRANIKRLVEGTESKVKWL